MRILHFKILYLEDEGLERNLYSGDAARTTAILKAILNSLDGDPRDLLKVRMRSPFRKPEVRSKNVLEIDFTYPSLMQRMVLGLLSRFGVTGAETAMQYIGNRFRGETLLRYLQRQSDPTLLIFDGLPSFHYLDEHLLKEARNLSHGVIYISHDYEPEFVGSKVIGAFAYKKLRTALKYSDIIVACSLLDKLSYSHHEMGVKDRIIVYPNIFPPREYLNLSLHRSAEKLTVAIVQGDWWGRRAILADALLLSDALSKLPGKRRLKVIAIGNLLSKALYDHLPGGVEYEGISGIPTREDYLKKLSEAHIGVNLAHRWGGTNVKKYDYALAGLTVLSNIIGARKETLPHEYIFTDSTDLSAKLKEFIGTGIENLTRMGEANRSYAIHMAEQSSVSLRMRVQELVANQGGNSSNRLS